MVSNNKNNVYFETTKNFIIYYLFEYLAITEAHPK